MKVLIANRGEIAVRVARACRDIDVPSVAVYADPDRDALHVRLADEAYALNGATPADTYLRIDVLLEIAARSGADTVHPGYGFLAENADFARAALDAGLTWVGPPPAAIDALGDKVSARRIARTVGAPLAPGTPGPVSGADEVLAFAREYGLPVAIKAAYGGGGRGLKVARTLDEIPDQFDSAVREAVAAFGRGECFVERYLDRPRHVETQCLADQRGSVSVISTRDCSLQRRHQKLVEEAPAPFLSADQIRTVYEASKAILTEAGYVGAGTCEFLVAVDGTISFLEVNTRLQVEHPVTEEITGLDLVHEQFRIARGEPLGYTDPPSRGHAIEFRINAEDPGRGFLPAPGTLTRWHPPSGPGVRLDGGYDQGETIPGAFDSLIAKLIVTGRDRDEALRRSRRALAEFEVAGMPTVLPFHRALLDEPAFTGADGTYGCHTHWIESEFAGGIEPYAGGVPGDGSAGSLGSTDSTNSAGSAERERVTVEVSGKRFEVVLPAGLGTVRAAGNGPNRPRRTSRSRSAPAAVSGDALTSPMQGTLVKVVVADGDRVEAGATIVVLEAMKMEQPVIAHKAGTVTALRAVVGSSVSAGAVLCEIKDQPR